MMTAQPPGFKPANATHLISCKTSGCTAFMLCRKFTDPCRDRANRRTRPRLPSQLVSQCAENTNEPQRNRAPGSTLAVHTRACRRRRLTEATPRGFKPLRAEPNGFRVHLLNRSDTVSLVWARAARCTLGPGLRARRPSQLRLQRAHPAAGWRCGLALFSLAWACDGSFKPPALCKFGAIPAAAPWPNG